jgi:hypothetical protein
LIRAGSRPSAGSRPRWGILLVVTALIVAAAGAYAGVAFQRFEDSRTAAS